MTQQAATCSCAQGTTEVAKRQQTNPRSALSYSPHVNQNACDVSATRTAELRHHCCMDSPSCPETKKNSLFTLFNNNVSSTQTTWRRVRGEDNHKWRYVKDLEGGSCDHFQLRSRRLNSLLQCLPGPIIFLELSIFVH